MKQYICKGKEENCFFFKDNPSTINGCYKHMIPHEFIKGVCDEPSLSPNHRCYCRPLNLEEIMREIIKDHEESEDES